MSEDREDRIRRRAYRLWEDDGSPEGRPDEYWSRAVAQIDAETGTPAASPSSDQAGKRRIAGDPLQENDAVPPAEAAREKRRG